MKYNINTVHIMLSEDETLVEGSVKVHTAEFEFDASWDGYTPIAVFKRGGELREQVIVDGKCEIPWEMLQKGLGGYLTVGVYGITDTKRRPTLWAAPKVVHPGTASGDASREPTPDIAQQLVKMLNVDIEDIDGGHRVTFNDVSGVKPFDVMDGTSVAVASVTESEESGGENVVEFTDGKKLKVKNGATGPAGKDYILTDTDKSEIAQKSTVSGYLTIPASAWKDDSSIDIAEKPMRIGVFDGVTSDRNSLAFVRTDGNEIIYVTSEWQTFKGHFTIWQPFKNLCLQVYGGKSVTYVQPYDIADVKIYRADDTAKTNLVCDDIAKLNWWQYDSTDNRNRLAISYEDGLKYLHVFRQYGSGANISGAAWNTMCNETADEFPAGTYVLECRMRTTCNQLYCTLPLDGIRDASATTITPIRATLSAFERYGVRGFAQRIGEISFTADKKPSEVEDITVAVSASYGKGGAMIHTHTSPTGIKEIYSATDSMNSMLDMNLDDLMVDGVTLNFPNVTFVNRALRGSRIKKGYFKSADSVETKAFSNCTYLEIVDLGNPGVDRILFEANDIFEGCSSLKAVIFRSRVIGTEIGTAATLMMNILDLGAYIYVPRTAISRYTSLLNSASIRILEDYTVDGTAIGKIDESKI